MFPASSERIVRAGSLGLAVFGLAVGGVAALAGADDLASACWLATTLLGVVLALAWVVLAVRRGRLGVDLIALAALIGTIFVNQFLAGAVITVMLTTGRALEAWAAGRAERELGALLEHRPGVAHRYEQGQLLDCPPDTIAIGDVLLVQPGEVVPVDGTLRTGPVVLDESALTGEALPVRREAADAVRSGVVNAGGPFDLIATTTSSDSTYAGIVRLVEEASASTSPFVRLADRYAVAFLAVSFATAGLAWLVSGDAVRAVAVLVVATPCPLILAAPVAIVAGLSRCARRGVVVKGGGALEALAQADVLLFDKTGTLTVGRPTILEVVTANGVDGAELLRMAASLDQVSPHVLAAAIVRAARQRGLDLVLPTGASEQPGAGVEGLVLGRSVRVGNGKWTGVAGHEPWALRARSLAQFEGAVCVFVGIDDAPAGALILIDPIRTDAARTIRNLRRSGIRRVVMVTGDRAEVAASVGAMLGLDDIAAQQTPADKVETVRRETSHGSTIMVGDGINDAPALAAANVGVAIGARGSTASSETADVVLTVDRLDRLGDAHMIAKRSRSIAIQSVMIGMALSLLAMCAAAFGLIAPSRGALLQEIIDVGVILNALRALRSGRGEMHLAETSAAVARQFATAHRTLRPEVALLLDAADRLGTDTSTDAMDAVHRAHRLLVNEIGPHEREEDRLLYPVVAQALGGRDPTGTMSRAHAEIAKLISQMGLVLTRIGDDRPSQSDVRELRRLLYGLYALLELHFAQEDESFLSLADDATDPCSHETTVTQANVTPRADHQA
jgi:heavy metal translocating P-type ATPase